MKTFFEIRENMAMRSFEDLREKTTKLDEVSTDKLRDYASAALRDKNKAKADKRWKYAGKAMQKVADRDVKAKHDLKYNKTEAVDEGIVKPYQMAASKPWSVNVKRAKGTAGEYSQIAKGKDFTVWTGYVGSQKRMPHYVIRDDKLIGSGWTMNSALKDAGLKDKDLTARSKFARGSILNKGMKESVTEEKHPALKRAGVSAFNKPKRTPNHPSSSHIVVTKVDGKPKTIRFGQHGAKTAGAPKEGESDRMKAKRKSFKARHAKNIAKGKSSAAYWADKVKW